MRVGISFIAVYEILIFLTWILAPKINMGIVRLGFDKTASEFLQMLLITLAPAAAIMAVMAILRAVFRSRGKISGDVYTAGATMLPWGAMLLSARC